MIGRAIGCAGPAAQVVQIALNLDKGQDRGAGPGQHRRAQKAGKAMVAFVVINPKARRLNQEAGAV
jgi:hypothetical protein